MVTDAELATAISAAENAYHENVDESLAEAFTSKVADKKGGMPFGEALRFSLNELHIWNKSKRRLYSSVAGRYFGRRGGHKSSRVKRTRSTPRASKPAQTRQGQGGTVEKDGQRRFNF